MQSDQNETNKKNENRIESEHLHQADRTKKTNTTLFVANFIEFAGNTDSEFEARIAGSKKWTFLTR